MCTNFQKEGISIRPDLLTTRSFWPHVLGSVHREWDVGGPMSFMQMEGSIVLDVAKRVAPNRKAKGWG